MKRQFRLLQIAGVVSVLLALMVAGVAVATTITVDGTVTDWPGDDSTSHTLGTVSCSAGSAGCATLLTNTDLDEVPDTITGIRDQFDIEQIWFTNNSTQGYFRLDTYANIQLIGVPIGTSTISFCIDEDNDIGTGYGISGCDNIGAECLVNLDNGASVTVYDLEGSTQASGSFVRSGRFVEIAFPLGTCGLTNGNYSVEVFFNNGAQDLDDNIPDTGLANLPVGSGSPTTITLASVKAYPSTSVLVGLLAAVTLLAAGGLVLFRRRRA